MVDNHDWSRSLGDSLDETIQKSGVLPFLDERTGDFTAVDQASDREELIEHVRAIVAAELLKVAWSFNARTELQAPNNVAYFLEQRAKAITKATLSWHVTVVFLNGEPDAWTETYPQDSYGLAVAEARRVQSSFPGSTSTNIWYGAKTHG